MPRGLKRYYTGRDLHFITCSCYRRKPLLNSARRRDLFLRVLEEVRCRYRFTVVGYVVMPEHFHLLVSEPERGTSSTVMQVLKQRVSRAIRRKRKADCGQPRLWAAEVEQEDSFWQRRFHDFNVWSASKEREKLTYMHYNPVQRGLVSRPEHWAWSSARDYAGDKARPVKVNQ